MWRELRRRGEILDAVRATLNLQEEIGLEIDRLAEYRDRLLERSQDLLKKYDEEFPNGTG